MGEFTAREVANFTAVMKRDDTPDKIDQDVSNLMEKLGLSEVCDGIIGTMIFRGLSGGQKKRAEIASELIASPSVLLIDEPSRLSLTFL